MISCRVFFAPFAFCFVLFFSGFVQADDIAATDFAYQLPLGEVSGSVGKITLPDAVYTHVAEANLDDLRVYNATGESVPFAVLQMTGEYQNIEASVSVPFYPIVGFANQTTVNEWIISHVEGVERSIYETRLKKLNGTRGFLLDLRAIKDQICALQFTWKSKTVNFVHHVAVEASADLENWQSLNPSATLAVFAHAGLTLQHDRIELPLGKYKFLRLSVLDAKSNADIDFMIDTIRAKTSNQTWQQAAMASKTVKGVLAENEPQALVFDTEGHFPANSLQFVFDGETYFYQAKLYASSDAKTWRFKNDAALYQLSFAEKNLKSEALPVSVSRERYWKLMFAQSAPKSVELQLHYHPETLLFFAQGAAPYALHFGFKNVPKLVTDIFSLLKTMRVDVKDLPEVSVLPLVTLRDTILDLQKIQQDKAHAAKEGKRHFIWLILLVSVGLLALMTYRMLQQMRRKE